MNYRERVGQNINYYRKLNDLTLKQIATSVGITEATMQKYEAGQIKRIDIDMVEKIASAIGVSAAQLTGWLDKEAEALAHENRIKSQLDNAQKIGITKSEMQLIIKHRKEKASHADNEVSDEIDRALLFYEKYKNAIPQVQSAIEALLKDSQP